MREKPFAATVSLVAVTPAGAGSSSARLTIGNHDGGVRPKSQWLPCAAGPPERKRLYALIPAPKRSAGQNRPHSPPPRHCKERQRGRNLVMQRTDRRHSELASLIIDAALVSHMQWALAGYRPNPAGAECVFAWQRYSLTRRPIPLRT